MILSTQTQTKCSKKQFGGSYNFVITQSMLRTTYPLLCLFIQQNYFKQFCPKINCLGTFPFHICKWIEHNEIFLVSDDHLNVSKIFYFIIAVDLPVSNYFWKHVMDFYFPPSLTSYSGYLLVKDTEFLWCHQLFSVVMTLTAVPE